MEITCSKCGGTLCGGIRIDDAYWCADCVVSHIKDLNNRIREVLSVASYTGYGDVQHKLWVIDQIAMAAAGDGYDAWVSDYPDWDKGEAAWSR